MYAPVQATRSRTVGGVRPGDLRRALAWLLLLCAVILGIVTMHTLGHFVDHGRSAVSASASHMTADAHTDVPVAPTQEAGTGISHPAPGEAASDAAGSGSGLVPDPFSVCLAVLLAAGALIALRRWTLISRALQRGKAGPPGPFSPLGLRGPPGLGLPIIRVAVLRI